MRRGDQIEGEPAARAVVPSHCIRVTGEMARVAIPGQGTVEPRVELVCEGDVVRAIDITCPCGQRVRLRCVYEK